MAKRIATPHTDAVVCCIVDEDRKLLLSGGEDGLLCFSDLTAMRSVGRLHQHEGDAVTSICCTPSGGAFAAAGSSVLCLDLRRGLGEEAVRDTYRINQEEVNSVAVNSDGTWLAAGDDSGEVQVIDVSSAGEARAAGGRPSYKTLRRGHTNICSAVAFRSHKPWEALSGGLDCTVVRWDFKRLRALQTWETDDPAACRLMAVGRGDGVVAVYNADVKPVSLPFLPKKGAKSKAGPSKTTGEGAKSKLAAAGEPPASSPLLSVLGSDVGGHTAAANCVCFVEGSHWQRLLSCGNDRRLLLWRWPAERVQGPEGEGALSEGPRKLLLDHRHGAKMNCVCSSAAGPGYDCYVADVWGGVTALNVNALGGA